MTNCPICGKPLIIAQIKHKYKRDWIPFIKTYREQTTEMVCNNMNFKQEPKKIYDEESGKMIEVINITPCPNYCGTDLNNPKVIVDTVVVKTE